MRACGAPAPAYTAAATKFCSNCGHAVVPGKGACISCGAPYNFGVSLAAPTVATPASGGGEGLLPGVTVGSVFAGRYRIDQVLGQGGMGVVYRAHDLQRGTTAAIKVVTPPTGSAVDVMERFKREALLLARLRHPGIPALEGSGRVGACMYVATEFVDGRDLARALKAGGRMRADEAARVVAAVCDALAAAHEAGVVHRDIKPSNIMLTADGAPKLIDFGIARPTGIDAETLTRTGCFVGTPEYMSPEQLGSGHIDERSDIYSLGVVLYELLTGRRPHEGDSPVAVIRQRLYGMPPAPRSIDESIPPWIERITLRCLDQDPAKRFDSAAELAAVLRKSHRSRMRRRQMPNGDSLIESEGDVEHPLVIECPRERPEWTRGVALFYAEKFYELAEIQAASSERPQWTYRFADWPEGRVFRQMVDYGALAGRPTSMLDRLRQKMPWARS